MHHFYTIYLYLAAKESSHQKPELTVEEAAGLALVDGVLRKANKAREIQKKVTNRD